MTIRIQPRGASGNPLLGLRPPASGCWWNPAGQGVTTGVMTLNEMDCWPVPFPAMTITDAALEVSTASSSGFLRMGLYADLDGAPDIASGPVADFGQQSSGTTGVKTWSGLSVALQEGIYWLALVPQTSTCTIRSKLANPGALPITLVPGDTIVNSAAKNAKAITGVSGALPSSGTLVGVNQNFPDVFFKAA